jgi:hypothetical protein
MEMKKIEVNLGVGLNMFFPEPVTIIIEDEVNEEPVKKRGRKPKVKKEKEYHMSYYRIKIERRLNKNKDE